MKSLSVFIMLLGTLILATACGNSGNDDNNGLGGSVIIDGSGTVYPFMARMAENYMVNKEKDVSVEVSRAGTSAGFMKFLQKNGTDYNNASRHIKNEEIEKAEKLGIDVQELKIALDGITIVVNKENDWATELTQQEVIDIFLEKSGMKKWSDVRPDFPNEKIKTYGPNENHGTYEFMFESILGEQDLVKGINLQQDYSTLVDLVSKDKNAIGFFGYGYYANNQNKLTGVKVDFGKGPVEPTVETIAEDGPYAPFTRAIYSYLNVNHAEKKPQVLDFAIYMMEQAQEVAKETGFAPISDKDLQDTLSAIKTYQQ